MENDGERLAEGVERRYGQAVAHFGGRLSRSGSLYLGIKMCVMPAQTAPRTFSLRPPIGRALPDRAIPTVRDSLTLRDTSRWFLTNSTRVGVAVDAHPACSPSRSYCP